MLFRVYRSILSPLIHGLIGPWAGCRFHPTCSVYFEQAVSTRGVLRGGVFGLRRVFRCHPFSRAPYLDPIPCDNDQAGHKPCREYKG